MYNSKTCFVKGMTPGFHHFCDSLAGKPLSDFSYNSSKVQFLLRGFLSQHCGGNGVASIRTSRTSDANPCSSLASTPADGAGGTSFTTRRYEGSSLIEKAIVGCPLF
jgi:hypothetical protein